jgi:hypothetical protein
MRYFEEMKKTCQVTLKLTENDFELLKDISEQTGCSTQALIRQMIQAVRKQWSSQGRLSLPLALAEASHDWVASETEIKGKFSAKDG